MGVEEKDLAALVRLVKAQDRLLAAYRLGRHPGEKTLDEIGRLKSRLHILIYGREEVGA